MSGSIRRWFFNPWLQLAICVLLGAAAEIFFKIGVRETANPDSLWAWTGLSGLRSDWVWFGVVASVVSLFNWLATIRQLPLTLAFPAANMVHILVPLGSWVFLGETLSFYRWSGVALLLIGLLIIAKPAARLEERL